MILEKSLFYNSDTIVFEDVGSQTLMSTWERGMQQRGPKKACIIKLLSFGKPEPGEVFIRGRIKRYSMAEILEGGDR